MSWRVAGTVGVIEARQAGALSRGSRGRVGITKEEIAQKLKSLVLKRTGGTDIAAQKRFFALYDTDKDGHLGKAEVSKLLDDAEACAWVGCDMTASKVIEAIDRDGDGKVSWAEYAVSAGIVETAGKATDPKAKFFSEIIAALEDARRDLAKEDAAKAAGPLTPATARAEEQGGDFLPVLVSLVTGAFSVMSLATVAYRTG